MKQVSSFRLRFPNLAPLVAYTLSLIVVVVLAVGAGAQSPPATNAAGDHEQFLRRLVAAAIERTSHTVRYDPAYVRIPYPNGDVPAGTGVCTDEIIRSYRAVGIDLQKEVDEDILRAPSAYPLKSFGVSHPDTNIDHRRVPNLMVFFARSGEKLAITANAHDYSPGDLVAWNLGANVTHIGIVVDRRSAGSGRYMIVHNIGRGPQMEDVLFDWKIIGHYRYFGPPAR
jgi:uncharacterized protein